MKKRGVRLSKALIKAQLLSILFLFLTAIVIRVILVNIPGTASARMWQFVTVINHGNPQVVYSDYFIKLSAVLNREDWQVYSPICFLIGGIVFGWVLSQRQQISYIAKAAALTSLIWSAIILVLCAAGTAAQANIASRFGLPMPQFTWPVAEMIVIQSVYWTAFFVAGSQVKALTSKLAHQPLAHTAAQK